MFIPVFSDIGFLCSNIRIEANEASYDLDLRNHDIETQDERHEEKSKGLPHGRQAHVSI